jgi:hypothetical protein
VSAQHQKKPEFMDSEQEHEERREVADPKERDRRVIPRISVPSLQVSLGHMRIICRVWIAFSVLFIVGLVSSNFFSGHNDWSRTCFYSVIVATVGIACDQLRRSINFFLFSHSQMKLAMVVERTLALVFVSTIIGIIFGVAHLLSVFG